MVKVLNYKLTSSQVILLAFLTVIFVGGLILTLPISSAQGVWTSFPDALFTAVSSTCVTGLVVRDTATYWSVFGQAVIIFLIQIGGIGVITAAFIIRVFSGSKISLIQRILLQQSISGDNVKGIIKMSLFVIRNVALIELGGAVLLYIVFCQDFGPIRGIWYALFHSISAFCNAGFDLMGVVKPFSSLTTYSTNFIINFVIMALIVIGGIGFYTWRDVADYGLNIKRYHLQSKIALVTTACLIVIPAVLFMLFEYGNLSFYPKALAGFFQSVTTRTAGFNTTDLTQLSDNGIFLMVILMIIGGSPGSTAGGMKTVTFAILVATAIGVVKKQRETVAFKRRIPLKTVRHAAALLLLYVGCVIVGAMAISAIEKLPLLSCLFETASAIGTVGLTVGITPSLGLASKIILMALMFIGRIGGLTFLFATVPQSRDNSLELPAEDVNVG